MAERSSGVWRLRVYVGDDPLTGNPRQVHRTFKGTEKEASRALAVLVGRIEDHQVDRSSATVGQLLDRWLEQIEPTRRPRTVAEYRRKIEHDIRPAIGSIRVDRLEADVLDRCYGQWLATGLAPGTVRHLSAIISAALGQGVKWGWLATNPAARSSPPSAQSPTMKIPTVEELSALYRASTDDQILATAVAMAALTGARRGELVALRWSDVDMAAGTVTFARSISVVKGTTHEGPTKTHQVRRLALDETAVEVLRLRWADQLDLSQRAESPLVDDPYVLSHNANGGTSVNPDTISHRFSALCTKTGLSFRFHDLRHFSVSTLIAAGIDVRTVAERQGHAQATMTLNRYAHALPERDRAAANVLGQTLKGG